MRKLFRLLVLPIVAAAALTAAAAPDHILDLPVTEVDGSKYYVYQTYRGDNLADIAERLGLTREEIIECNPWAKDGLKSGQLLMFPVEKFSDVHTDGKVTSTHTVARGESLFGIAHRYGMKPDDLIVANPSARHGIKTGDVLVIPLIGDPEPPAAPAPAAPTPAPAPAAPTPALAPAADPEPDFVLDEDAEPVAVPELPMPDRRLRDPKPDLIVEPIALDEVDESSDQADVTPALDRAIALLLPFMLDQEEPSRQAELFTDFYKGMLMGINDMVSMRSDSVQLRVFDTAADTTRLASLLADPKVSRAAVIIPPDNDVSLRMVADMALENGNMVFNVLNVRDTTYLSNPNILQANIPQPLMYRKAVDYLMDRMPDYTPVILTNKGSQSDKAAFIEYLRGRYADRERQVVDIVFEGSLHNVDFDSLEVDRRYVLIPSSGSATEFNKISHIVRNLRNTRGDEQLTRIFGYPDWLAFRGDARHMLHQLDAEIFSRFHYDTPTESADELAESFRKWYGHAMLPTVPSQAILGYDTGCYLMKVMNLTEGADLDPDTLPTYRGKQTSFDILPQQPGEQYVNEALYIVRFTPEGTITHNVF